jgi:hypothetical protein
MSRSTVTATIASGQALSGAIELNEHAAHRLLALVMPAAWTTANLTFQAAATLDGTYQNLHNDEGTEVSVTAAASRVIAIDKAVASLAPLRFLKIRSGTGATPVNQAADRTLTLLVKA